MLEAPRIESVTAVGPTTVVVAWRGGRESTVDLAGWIGRDNPRIAPLRDAEMFKRASVGALGGNITWDGDEGDLAIDAIHLAMIADEQEPFRAAEAAAWQAELGLSNQEAAGLLGVVPSTWNAYKAGATIPATIARLCRAAHRDPVILHAHLKPRTPGRPKGTGAPA